MFDAFKSRQPWAAGLVALLLGPEAGLCNVNQGRSALVYFALLIGWTAFMLFALLKGIILHVSVAIAATVIALVLIRLGGILQASLSASKLQLPMRWYSRWYVVLLVVAVPALLGISFRHFCFEPFHVLSDSMSPTLNSGDYFFVEKRGLWRSPPARGDVIALKVSRYPHTVFIKRVVGMPGDRVQLKSGVLYINGAAVPQRQVKDFMLYDKGGNQAVPQFVERLPGGREYPILKDARKHVLENTPLYTVPEQAYFVLGDNRDSSNDTRFFLGGLGFVPESDIRGKAVEKIYNYRVDIFAPEPVE